MPDANTPVPPPTAGTGISGLDALLDGGFPREEMHLAQGVAGTGKTTMALQYLRAGRAAGEATLYLTLSQSKEHLERIARSHGWDLTGIRVHELAPGTLADRIAGRQTILPSADVEIEAAFRELSGVVADVRPRRAVIDSLTIFQLLAGSAQRYHREVILLRQLLIESRCTVLALSDHPADGVQGHDPEVMLHPLCGCVIQLEAMPRSYGDARRRLRVVKARGVDHEGGYHDLKIVTGGMTVYPRLGAYDEPEHTVFELVSTRVRSLDHLLGGGLNTGTSCLVVGPSGVGKSTLACLFAESVARAGGHAAMFLLDERPQIYVARSEGLGVPLRDLWEAGSLLIEQIDPGRITPGEFAHDIRRLVEERGTRVVVIDSIVGYFAAMGGPDVLVTQLHELLTWLTRRGVLLLMCAAQEGFMSIGRQDAVDVSYLSDTILALSFYEADGGLHRAIVVVKKKYGSHVDAIHELTLADGSIEVSRKAIRGHEGLMVPAHGGKPG